MKFRKSFRDALDTLTVLRWLVPFSLIGCCTPKLTSMDMNHCRGWQILILLYEWSTFNLKASKCVGNKHGHACMTQAALMWRPPFVQSRWHSRDEATACQRQQEGRHTDASGLITQLLLRLYYSFRIRALQSWLQKSNRNRPTEQRNGTEQDQNGRPDRTEIEPVMTRRVNGLSKSRKKMHGRLATRSSPAVWWQRPSHHIQAVGFGLKSVFQTAITIIYKEKYYKNSISRFKLKSSEQLDIISIFVFYRLLKKFPLLFFSLYQHLLYLTLYTYIIDILLKFYM
jgi:hypothetical protein